MDKIKEWKTQSVKHKVAMLLILDGVSFRYNERDGIVFSATEFYVKNMKHRLMTSFGVSLKPIINVIK